MSEADVARKVKDMELVRKAGAAVQTPPGSGKAVPAPPAKPAEPKDAKDELGEEFEEIR